MKRRHFLQTLGAGSLAGALPTSFNLYGANESFEGKFLVAVQVDGAWDPTSFCDPKINVQGEPEINTWAQTLDPLSAGNINFAPFAANQAFFEKYYQDMLVVNGVDAQTNSHSVGVTHNWSGRLSAGYPTLTALYAARHGANMPLAYVNNGGYAETSGTVRYSQLNNVEPILNVINPNTHIQSQQNYLLPEEWEKLTTARSERMARLAAAQNLTSLTSANINAQSKAFNNSALLRDFETVLRNAGELQSPIHNRSYTVTLRRQAQIALLAMSAGVTAAADLHITGFDTHANHDADHSWLLTQLTDGIDYLWEYAESLGIADRLVVLVSSDFGRTPWYNDNNGKDHWPVGSTLVMERNQSYTNRVVGLTDEGHEVIPINSSTLETDNSAGVIIHPENVMQELRTYLGINDFANELGFTLAPANHFGFFG